NYFLKYAAWNGTGWSKETIDHGGDTGGHTSLALDSLGNPGISYYDGIQKDLKYASWNGSAWEITVIDSAGNVGYYTSLSRDSHGYPGISYYSATSMHLKYAAWNGSSWTISTVDPENKGGSYSSLALNSRDYPGISYFSTGQKSLKYASWDGSAWNCEVVDSIGSGGGYTALRFDHNDNPCISYFDSTSADLKYAVKTGNFWTIVTVDSTGSAGTYSSLALDRNDLPHISYQGTTVSNRLMYAKSLPPVVSDFSASPKDGNAPLQVAFIDASAGNATSWEWYFGDGEIATVQNPHHTYTHAGTYTVYLTSANEYYRNTTARIGYISVEKTNLPVSAGFTGTPLMGQEPLTVSFIDTSTGTIFDWNWSFGDGVFSGDQNPVHTYTTPGLYTVSLTVENSAYRDIIVLPTYVNVTPLSLPPGRGGGEYVSGGSGVAQMPKKPSDLTFFVDADYLSEHHIMPADVVLMSFTDNKWIELPTRFTGASGNRFYYEADSDRYHLIAVGNQKEGSTTLPHVSQRPPVYGTAPYPYEQSPELKSVVKSEQSPSYRITTVVPVLENSTSLPYQQPIDPRPATSQGYLMIAIVGCLSVSAGIFLIIRRWWIRRQNPALFQDYD
ncbi:MAG: PKD domain-containing protein, partial [Methanoregula sp.]|nr:PKD domain-containing protein [Methanoregula sp.]